MNKKQEVEFKPQKSRRWVGGYFCFTDFQTTLKKECLGGLTTFLALIYILSANPNILSQAPSLDSTNETPLFMNQFGIFLTTALVSFLGSFFMGLFANVPIVMTCTMGMNTLFTFSLAKMGLGFEGAMIVVTFSAIFFSVVTITPLKEMVLQALPSSLTLGFTIALGFFIAYVGFQQIGLIAISANGLPIASLNTLRNHYPMIILGLGTLLIMLFSHFRKLPGGVALALLIGFLVTIFIANTVPQNSQWVQPNGPFANANFRQGFLWNYDWKGWTWNLTIGWKAFVRPEIWTNPVFYLGILLVTLMCFFDGMSSLTMLTHQLERPETLKLIRRELTIDAWSGISNGFLGVSSLGATVESAVGIHQGAKTGWAAIVTGLMFLFAIPLYPIFKIVPTFVTGAACIYIGLLIATNITKIEWEKPEFAFATFLTIVVAMITYTLLNGIAIGIITYTLIMIFSGQAKRVNWLLWPLNLLMIGYFGALVFIQN